MPRILLVEDNPANLELMRYLLRAFGYEAETATDGETALERLASGPWSLVVCDIQLPGIDGFEVARRVRADPAHRNLAVVAVTALAMVGDREKVLGAGFDGYIAKPIDPETFVREVEAFLHGEQRKGVELPRAPSTEGPATPASRRTILVVDNSPLNHLLARSILEPHGYRVLTAGGVATGLELARRHPVDLILSDVHMGDETGYELVAAVRADERLRGLPFVFITSTWTDEASRAKGLALGADRFLFRPIEPQALLAAIEGCLREPR